MERKGILLHRDRGVVAKTGDCARKMAFMGAVNGGKRRGRRLLRKLCLKEVAGTALRDDCDDAGLGEPG